MINDSCLECKHSHMTKALGDMCRHPKVMEFGCCFCTNERRKFSWKNRETWFSPCGKNGKLFDQKDAGWLPDPEPIYRTICLSDFYEPISQFFDETGYDDDTG